LEQLDDPSGHRAEGTYTPSGLWVWSTYSADIEFDVGATGVAGIDSILPLGYLVTGTLAPTPGNSSTGQPTLCEPTGKDCTGGWFLEGAGTYKTPPVPAGTYVLKIYTVSGGQSVYWSSTGLVADLASATPITITSASVSGINGQLPW
jgi:hypothetical protein